MTVMKLTTATSDAVSYVLDNLWERGQRELAILGVTADQARSVLDQQNRNGLPTMAMWVDDEPVLICGLMRTDNPAAMCTWFQATEMFTHHARAITRELRDKLGEAARHYNLEYIEIISPCTHPKTGRWFGALGFRLDVDRYMTVREGSKDRLYRFVRHFGDCHVLPQA